MKQRIIEITSKLFLLFAIGLSFIGMTKANVTNQNTVARRLQVIGTLRHQLSDEKQKTSGLTTKNISKNGFPITEINQTNFDLGWRLAMVVFEADGFEGVEGGYQYLVVDLAELIDKFEGKTEGIELQKVLRSVIRGTADSAEVKQELERIAKEYRSAQAK